MRRALLKGFWKSVRSKKNLTSSAQKSPVDKAGPAAAAMARKRMGKKGLDWQEREIKKVRLAGKAGKSLAAFQPTLAYCLFQPAFSFFPCLFQLDIYPSFPPVCDSPCIWCARTNRERSCNYPMRLHLLRDLWCWRGLYVQHHLQVLQRSLLMQDSSLHKKNMSQQYSLWSP